MPPSNEAFSLTTILIKKCAATTTLKTARQLHALLLTAVPTALRSPYLYNNIISMYSRSGSLENARQMFDKMPQRNIYSFNAIISAHSRTTRDARTAFDLLCRLEIEGLRKIGPTFTSLVQASSLLGDIILGGMLHARVIKFGFLGDTLVETALLNMYSNCGDLNSSKMVFISMVEKDAMAWNSMIIGYMKNDKVLGGISLYGRMMKSGVAPTNYTYSKVLGACGRQKNSAFGKIIHAHVILSGIMGDLALYNSLLDMYCNFGDVHIASKVFQKIDYPDLISWNTILSGYSDSGPGHEAMNLFIELQKMPSVRPDEFTYVAILSASKGFGASDYGKPLHTQIIKSGHEKSVYIASKLISMYFNNSESDSAQKVFESTSIKDAVLWTEMITGHCRMADGENAIKLFCEMLREGQKVDSFSLSIALSACADLTILKQGEMFHSLALKTGYIFEISVTGSLIDTYAKNGELEAAESILYQIEFPDLKCWNVLLRGYGHHGKAEKAINIFNVILENGFRPDEVTFICLLSACGHSGLVEKGKYFWKYMVENGINPGPKHYSCMVSLLSRAGLLEETEKMILASPYNVDNFDLWRTLLSSCIANKNYEIGIRAAEQVLSIDENESATLILLSNLYAATGKWENVVKMRRKMREMVMEKDPGLSWIEIKNEVRVFSSGDEIDELQDVLCRLFGKLKRSEINEINPGI